MRTFHSFSLIRGLLRLVLSHVNAFISLADVNFCYDKLLHSTLVYRTCSRIGLLYTVYHVIISTSCIVSIYVDIIHIDVQYCGKILAGKILTEKLERIGTVMSYLKIRFQ